MSDGPNLYQYIHGNPISLSDPSGRKSENPIQIFNCYRTAQIPGGTLLGKCNLLHQWLKGGGKEVGMGNAKGIPGQGGQTSPDCPYSSTQLVDHTGESGKKGSNCTPVCGVDYDCVLSWMTVGTKTGPWVPSINDCNSWANGVLSMCTPRDWTNYGTIENPLSPDNPMGPGDEVFTPDGIRKANRITCKGIISFEVD
jgi:hypothetical protein